MFGKHAITWQLGITCTIPGEMCLDPNGEYEITIEPVYHDPDAADLVMKEVFVTHPDDGNSAFPDNKKLADLWDEYIAEVRGMLLVFSLSV